MMDALFDKPEELILRPTQEDIVAKLMDELSEHRRVILMAATGLGKTVIATYMIKEFLREGKRCLFVNDRRQLVEETSAVFDRFGVDHGVIMADHKRYRPDNLVQVGSVQTLNRRRVGKFDLIVVDEAHTIYSGHEKILAKNPEAYVIGLTATPFSKGLGKYFKKHIEPYPLRSLIDLGMICDFEVYGPETYDLSNVQTVAGEYHQGQLADAVDQTHLVADVVDTYKRLGRGRKTICFVQNVAHGRHLVRQFLRNGISAIEINAYLPDADRLERMESFVNGKTEVACSVEILIKGFDMTTVDCVVWATATKSHVKWIQGCGRGLRVHPGKSMCRIIDHGSNCARLGFPDDFQFNELDDGKRRESQTRTKDKVKEEKLPKRCPSCDFLKPAGVVKCPACGLVPEHAEPAETVDGNIVKLVRGKGKSTMKRSDWYAGFLAYAIAKGYKRGWAAYKYKSKFGTWPQRSSQIPPGEITQEIMNFITRENIRWAKSKYNQN